MDRRDERKYVRETRGIRQWNDQIRCTGFGGKLFLTRGVASLPSEQMSKVLRAVRTFDAFTPDNDPWGEHDFGKVEVDGTAYFWKIDAYDLDLEFGSPDPADASVTRRVLTIMTEMEV